MSTLTTTLDGIGPGSEHDGFTVGRPDRLEAVMEAANAVGACAALLSARDTLRWLGADAARYLVARGERVVAVTPSGTRPAAGAATNGASASDDAAGRLVRALARCGVAPGETIAIELAHLPRPLVWMLGWETCRDIGEELVRLRARKDDSELAAIARTAAYVDAGQRAVAACVRPGISELELWQAAQRALTVAIGDEVCVHVELAAGPRSATPGAPPTEATIGAGEPVLLSLACQHDGWWAAATATVCAGDADESLRARSATVWEALQRGRDAARPGAMACDVDRAMREHLAAAGLPAPRETGHAIGRSGREAPVLRPGVTTRLAPGTVLVLAPSTSADDGGVRLAETVVVDVGGARPLTASTGELSGADGRTR